MLEIWAQKYAPSTLKDLSFNPELTGVLENITKFQSIPNLILYGRDGSGKLTRVRAFLRELYGKKASQIRSDVLTINQNDGKTF